MPNRRSMPELDRNGSSSASFTSSSAATTSDATSLVTSVTKQRQLTANDILSVACCFRDLHVLPAHAAAAATVLDSDKHTKAIDNDKLRTVLDLWGKASSSAVPSS